MNRFTVNVPAGQLDLPLCVSSGQVFRWDKFADSHWLGVDGTNWFRVAIAGSDCFEVESNADESAFSSLFRLDWNAEVVERQLVGNGPELVPYLSALKGLRVMRSSDAGETLFCFLCTPNNHISRIGSMVRKLASFGDVMEVIDGVAVHRFPSAERIAAIHEQELRDLGFGYRGATIPRVAKQILANQKGWLESLKEGSYQDAHDELAALHGVGPKLADCIALFALDHGEAVPIDTHIWQALTRLYFPEWAGSALTGAKYRAAGDHFRSRFGALSGWAQQHLFYDNVLHGREARRAVKSGQKVTR